MATNYGEVATNSADLDGSTSALAAPNPQHIYDNGTTSNGAYWYKLPSGNVQLWTDFTTYSNFPMVLVTRMSVNDGKQYMTGANYQTDLTVANTTAPTRSAKISDADIRYIMDQSASKIRWVIVAEADCFYRMSSGGASWTSDFGISANCSYGRGHYNAYATPSNTPTWRTADIRHANCGACGSIQQGNSSGWNWLVISGIHHSGESHYGGYTGASSYRGTTPSAYLTTTAGNSQWTQPGYVFLSW